MATASLNLLGKETNLKRQKTKDQHMHIGQSVLITYCFGSVENYLKFHVPS